MCAGVTAVNPVLTPRDYYVRLVTVPKADGLYTRERHAKLRSNGHQVSDEEITMAVAGFHPQVALIEQLRPGLERTDERRVGDDGGRTGLRAFSSGSLNGWSMRRKNSDPYRASTRLTTMESSSDIS